MKKSYVEKGMICAIVLLFVGTGLADAVAVRNMNRTVNQGSIEVIDQQQTSDCGSGWNFFDPLWLAQGFTPTLPTLTKVELWLFRANSPPENVQITVSIISSLYGNVLATKTIDATDIYSTPSWVEFNFTDITVTPGDMYFILCHADGGSQGNCYCWVFDDNNPYTGGDAWGCEYGYYWFPLETPEHPSTDCCFKTYGLEEQPGTPEITGETSGTIGQTYNFTFVSTDPDGNILYYFVDWGDGQTTAWAGPYASGQLVTLSHVWSKRGTYTVKAKVKDAYNVESDWGTLKVKMPASFNIQMHGILEKILERFPRLFPLLRYLLDG